ncbi:hypothetical protein ABXS69_06915 [Actinomyces timonensis]|uniref:ABC-2 family transporter protein n=1 Tax=Actinomyces timonensis TaxID=1288391 RepID=A0AAU8N045_9ACTO
MSPRRLSGTRAWGAHARLRLRAERTWLITLPAVVLVLTALLSPSYGTAYSSEAAMARAVASARANDTMLLLYGSLSHGADPVQIAVWELGAMTCLGTSIVVVLRTASLTRGEEDRGRAELLHAASVGPARRVLGQALTLALLSALIGVGAGTGLLALDGAALADARAYGTAVALTCLLLAAQAHLAAQIASDAPGARWLGLAVLAAAYLVYGLSCSQEPGWADLPGRLSPFHLRQALSPGGQNAWLPALWGGCAWMLLVIITILTARRRDLGQGLVTMRSPRAGRPLGVGGPVPLALRLSRGGITVWALALSAAAWLLIDMGGAVVARAQEGAFDPDSGLGAILGGGDDAGEAFLGYVGSLIGALTALQAVSLANRAGADELVGRAEALASTGVRPARLLLAWWCAAAAGSGFALCCAAASAAGAGDGALGTGARDAVRLVAGQWPAALAAASVASAICGALPRWRGIAWLAPPICVGLIQFGATLDVPERVRAANPLAQAGRPGSWWLLGASAALVGIAVVRVRRRDLALASSSRSRRHPPHGIRPPAAPHREEERPCAL